MVLAMQISIILRLNRRLDSIERQTPALYRHYRHLPIFCSDPRHSARCWGWWVGFGAVFAVALSVAAGLVSDTWIPRTVGVPGTIALAVISLSLTPIHGSYNRNYDLPRTHWTRAPLLSATIGLLFALGTLATAELLAFVL